MYPIFRFLRRAFSIGVWRFFATHGSPTLYQRIAKLPWIQRAICWIKSAIGLPIASPSIFTSDNSFAFELYYGGMPLFQRIRSPIVFTIFCCVLAALTIILIVLTLYSLIHHLSLRFIGFPVLDIGILSAAIKSITSFSIKPKNLVYLLMLMIFILLSFGARNAFFRAHILFLERGDPLPNPNQSQAGTPVFNFLGRPRTYYLAVRIMGGERRDNYAIAKSALSNKDCWIYAYPRHSEHRYQTRFLADLAAHVTRIFLHGLLPAENHQPQRNGSLYFSYKTNQSLISVYLMLLCVALISLAPDFECLQAKIKPFLVLALAVWAVIGIWWARRIAFPRYRNWSHYLASTSLDSFFDARTYYFDERRREWRLTMINDIRNPLMGQLTPEQGIAIENILTFAVTGMVAIYLALLQLFK